MTEKKELNENELEQITGGKEVNIHGKKVVYTERIGEYNAIKNIGDEVIIIHSDFNIMAVGTLLKSKQHPYGCNSTRTLVEVKPNPNYAVASLSYNAEGNIEEYIDSASCNKLYKVDEYIY